jgi:riboflavin kinase
MYRTESLKKLALLGAIEKPVKISSSEFTRYTSTSSKTAARVLKQLEDEQYIERQMVAGGQMVQLREKGVDLLKNEYVEYSTIFCRDHNDIDLYGNIITGLGEGQYYISREGYMSQFRDKLGFKPYPGTLNVRLDGSSAEMRDRITLIRPVVVHGFSDGERSFGGGKCYQIEIEGIKGAVIIPDRTHYPADLLEIIAPVKLREMLRINDGDKVRIVVRDPQRCE